MTFFFWTVDAPPRRDDARGGDGRSFDGYGLDPDILLTSRAAHTRSALVRLARRLASARAIR